MIITTKTPKLDLHGEISSMVEVLVNEFIKDNYKIGNQEAIIIHGKSSDILRKEVHRVLKNNSYVKTFCLDNWNLGTTLVEINKKD